MFGENLVEGRCLRNMAKLMLGSEIDKPSKILIKSSNAQE